MEAVSRMMVHLDTHVVVWLAANRLDRLSSYATRLINRYRPVISPMVRLELSLLHDIGRISVPSHEAIEMLRVEIDLGVSESSFSRVAAVAGTLSWTRDPFDRLIAAHAMADDLPLLTCDKLMLKHCSVAVWDA